MEKYDNLVWKEEWSVGDRKLDSQHKKFIEIINELNTKEASQNPKVFARILSDLTDYFRVHRLSEEAYIEKHGCPFLKKHQAGHRWLTLQISRFNFEFNHLVPTNALKVFRLVSDWLLNHELTEDIGYKDFIAGKEVSVVMIDNMDHDEQ